MTDVPFYLIVHNDTLVGIGFNMALVGGDITGKHMIHLKSGEMSNMIPLTTDGAARWINKIGPPELVREPRDRFEFRFDVTDAYGSQMSV